MFKKHDFNFETLCKNKVVNVSKTLIASSHDLLKRIDERVLRVFNPPSFFILLSYGEIEDDVHVRPK